MSFSVKQDPKADVWRIVDDDTGKQYGSFETRRAAVQSLPEDGKAPDQPAVDEIAKKKAEAAKAKKKQAEEDEDVEDDEDD